MKKVLLPAFTILVFIAIANISIAQNAASTQTSLIYKGVINFKELADKELIHPPKLQKQRNNEEKEEDQKGIPHNLPVPKNAKVFNFNDDIVTPVLLDQVQKNSPPPIKKFAGLLDNNQVIPPDVNGAAGPNHLFETLNSQYRIFNKNGSTISTLSLAGFWSGLSSVGSPFSDPHVVYDAGAARWITCIIAQLKNGHYGLYIAASQTNDPTGSWYEYSFDTGPSTTLPDYPLLGYNKNWAVITTNDFINGFFAHARITVFNKSLLMAGTLSSSTTFTYNQFTISPAETMDLTQETEYMLANYNGNSGGKGYVKLFTVTGTASAPVFTAGSTLGVNTPWSDAQVDATQKGSSNLINTNGTRMRTVIVRNGFIWATQSISLPATAATRSSVAWWQIKPSPDSIVQRGILDDASGKYRLAFPSIAVTATNDLLLGCSLFGTPVYASGIYAYRKSTDGANKLRYPNLYIAGVAPYYKTFGSGRNRWGDYTATCMDPSDGTFWTLQEYASATNTWGTYWANVAAVAEPQAIAGMQHLFLKPTAL